MTDLPRLYKPDDDIHEQGFVEKACIIWKVKPLWLFTTGFLLCFLPFRHQSFKFSISSLHIPIFEWINSEWCASTRHRKRDAKVQPDFHRSPITSGTAMLSPMTASSKTTFLWEFTRLLRMLQPTYRQTSVFLKTCCLIFVLKTLASPHFIFKTLWCRFRK